MQGFTLAGITDAEKLNFNVKLTKSIDREIKVRGTGSRCVLDRYVKDNYYARFHFTPGSITDAEKMILQHNFDVKINIVNGP